MLIFINKSGYVEGMVDIISSYDAAVFAVIMDKPNGPIIVPEHHLPKQYFLLLKKIEFYCNHHHYSKAMLIFDEVHDDADRKIAEAITGFLFKTKFGRSFHHILENNHIPQSRSIEYGFQKMGKNFSYLA